MTINGLSELQLKHLVQQLEQQKALIESAIANHNIANIDYSSIAGEVHDSGDESVADLLNDTQIFSHQHAVSTLARTDDALQRIKEGHYGRCIDCKQNISYSRLEAYPEAKRCLKCKEEKEQYESLRSTTLGPSL